MRKNLIYIMITLAVLLLVGNMILKRSTDEVPEEKTIDEISTAEIENIFLSTIDLFNLDSSWVKKVHIKSQHYDSLQFVYKIELPSDLPPVLVLRSLREYFMKLPVDLISDEKTINGNTTLNFLSNDELKLQVSFNINEKIYRKHAELAIIISDVEELKENELSKILRSIIDLSFLLKPSVESDTLINTLSKFEKSYSILISDDAGTSIYSMKPNDTKTKLTEAVRYINWNYPAAQLHLIDNSSSLFNSASFNFVRDEFKKRNMNLRPLNELNQLPKEIDEAASLLSFYIESGLGKEGRILVIPASLFNNLESILLEAKRRGSKFYSPNELANK